MKVSGSHIENVRAWTKIGYEASEEVTIQRTVEKLSKEGKHVINIIHGDKTMIGGDYTKSITFLWEADDDEPAYRALLNKQAEAEEKNKKRDLLNKEIIDLEKRIYKAKKNVIVSEKDAIKKARKENRIPLVRFSIVIILFGLIGVIAGLIFVNEFRFNEGYIEFGLGLFLLLIGIPLLIYGKKLSPSKEELERIESKYVYLSKKENEQVSADKLIIQKLEKELNEKKQEHRSLM